MAKPFKAVTTSSLYQSIVYVLVGPQKQKFSIHKNLLCHHSSYFSAALNGSFKEAQEGIVELPYDDPAIFDIFKTWLYSKSLVKDCDGDETPCCASELVRLYVLADLRGVPRLKNAVIDELIDLKNWRQAVPITEIPYVYENTPPSSPLRTLFVDFVCWSMTLDTQNAFQERWLPYYTVAFLVDLVTAVDQLPCSVSAWDSSIAPYVVNACSYHEHAIGDGFCARRYG